MATLYHNPRCSKSRQGLELCNDSSTDVVVIKYLQQNLTEEQLRGIISRFKGEISQLIRTGDAAFKQSPFCDIDLTNSANVLAVLSALPQVMQRPLLDDGQQVVIGRPLDNFNLILD